ncbi:MAG: HupE/UreJ family protein [Deltaproteobacteria bacterium]
MRTEICLVSAVILAVFLFSAPAADAHPLAPSLLELNAEASGEVAVRWKVPALRVRGSDVHPELPAGCREMAPPTGRKEGEAVVLEWRVDCGPDGLVGRSVGVVGLGIGSNDALLRVSLPDGRVFRHVLRSEEPRWVVPESGRPDSVLWGYLRLGFDHILGGLDHLLFVLGLLLLATSPLLLVETITSFTVGHSVTLALASLGLAQVPVRPVEVLIAISILVLAVELARGREAKPTLLRRFPWGMAFFFGLLHGLGFAGALAQIGLPPDDLPLALFSFNLGIELGQLSFVAVVVLAGFLLRPLLRRRPVWLDLAPAYGIGCLAAYWVLERLFG